MPDFIMEQNELSEEWILSHFPARELNNFLWANTPAQESYLKNLIKISLVRLLLKVDVCMC